MTQDCDSIYWLVDILGTVELLSIVSKHYHAPDKVFTPEGNGRATRLRPDGTQDGLYYTGAHWHSVRGKKINDSYKAKYQMTGTAHFCQTFALMIHTKQTKGLVEGFFSQNIKVAMNFWIELFEKWPESSTYVANEVRTSDYGKKGETASYGVNNEVNFNLQNISEGDLIGFMKDVALSSDRLTGCKYG